MGEADEPAPTGRDYGCGLVALVAAVIGTLAVCGATWNLARDGVSAGVFFNLGVTLLFWYWVGVGAWRRTVWSRHHPTTSHPDDP